MRLFRKPLLILVSLALAGGAFAAKNEPAKAAAKEGEKSATGEKKKKKKDKGKESEKTPETAATPEANKNRMSLPLPPGHDSKGLKIPYYDTQGKLQMIFNIGVASRVKDHLVKMSDTQVETYNPDGEQEMTILLPTSVLDLDTRVITSNTKTTIKREDFTLTGDAIAFKTTTKEGWIVGNVHMTIYDLKTDVPAPAAKAE